MADPLSFLPPLSRYFQITTEYGAPVAAGPTKGEPHNAIDFGAPYGEPVFAMRDGIVLQPNGNPEGVTGGNTITIDYGDGIIATMAHLSEIDVRPGDRVKKGKKIGNVGNSGITTGHGGTSGAHLHLDVWDHGHKINPLNLFHWDADDISPKEYESGSSANVGDIVDFLQDQLADDIKDGKTWGEWGINSYPYGFFGANTPIDMDVEELRIAIDSLGWRDRKMSVTDIPIFAAELVKLGPDKGIGAVADWGKAIVDFVGAIVNPETWARVAAMVLGVIMAFFGAYMIWTTT